MRYFIHKSGATLQTPDKLDDIFECELEEGIIEEVSWSWYLSSVIQNQTSRDMKFLQDMDAPHEGYYHAKYYGRKYMNMDRISSYPRHYVKSTV
jgi:hypothetical protein